MSKLSKTVFISENGIQTEQRGSATALEVTTAEGETFSTIQKAIFKEAFAVGDSAWAVVDYQVRTREVGDKTYTNMVLDRIRAASSEEVAAAEASQQEMRGSYLPPELAAGLAASQTAPVAGRESAIAAQTALKAGTELLLAGQLDGIGLAKFIKAAVAVCETGAKDDRRLADLAAALGVNSLTAYSELAGESDDETAEEWA